jgi:hypothetical protein
MKPTHSRLRRRGGAAECGTRASDITASTRPAENGAAGYAVIAPSRLVNREVTKVKGRRSRL